MSLAIKLAIAVIGLLTAWLALNTAIIEKSPGVSDPQNVTTVEPPPKDGDRGREDYGSGGHLDSNGIPCGGYSADPLCWP
jgi:hypothetical protein